MEASPPAETRPAVEARPAEDTRATTPPSVEFSASLGYSYVDYETASYTLSYGALAGTAKLWLRPGIELAIGARGGFGSELTGAAFETFGAVSLVPRFKLLAGSTAVWRPGLGFELGRTTATYDEAGSANPYPPDGIASLRAEQPDELYGMVAASPLRVRAWNRLDASVFGVAFGTGLERPGAQVRAQLTLIEIAVVL